MNDRERIAAAPWLRAEIEMMHWGTVGDEHPDRGKSLVLLETVLLVIDAALAEPSAPAQPELDVWHSGRRSYIGAAPKRRNASSDPE